MIRGIGGSDQFVAEAAAAQVGFERIEPRRERIGRFAVELDQEDCPGIAPEKTTQAGGLGVELGAIEHVPVHDLDRRRLMGQDGRRGGERIEQVGELDDHHSLGPGQLDQAERGFDDQAERALRADEEMGEVEPCAGSPAGNEGVEVVSADTTHDFRIAALDLAGMLLGQPADHAIA